ncbi:hypothetical protein [Undibacterium sp. Ji49W]|uniref:hypothetical protein n=1 Tax=Undibacterium sp. Ji49W TaxID=3413040 RepID=UPI003BF089BB
MRSCGADVYIDKQHYKRSPDLLQGCCWWALLLNEIKQMTQPTQQYGLTNQHRQAELVRKFGEEQFSQLLAQLLRFEKTLADEESIQRERILGAIVFLAREGWPEDIAENIHIAEVNAPGLLYAATVKDERGGNVNSNEPIEMDDRHDVPDKRIDGLPPSTKQRQLNVQQQNALHKQNMANTVQAFRNRLPGQKQYRWVLELLDHARLHPAEGILLSYGSTPCGSNEAFAHVLWLSATARFYELNGIIDTDKSEILEIELVTDISGQTIVSAHLKGIGKSWGQLAIELLAEFFPGDTLVAQP